MSADEIAYPLELKASDIRDLSIQDKNKYRPTL